MTKKLFIVQLSEGRYVRDVDHRTVSTTDIPSAAVQLDYLKANDLAQRLRKNWGHTAVCDLLGFPITHEAIKAALSATEPDPLPETLEELAQIRFSVHRQRLYKEPAYAERVRELESTY